MSSDSQKSDNGSEIEKDDMGSQDAENAIYVHNRVTTKGKSKVKEDSDPYSVACQKL